MSLKSCLCSERNLLDETPEQARLLELDQPILTNQDLERIRNIDHPHLRSCTLATVFDPEPDGDASLKAALDALCRQASAAVESGTNILVLSDRDAGPEKIPIPSLLATGAVHHHLIREGLRTRCGLVIESGEPREVAHFALLIGYGAGAINPYLAFDSIDQLAEESTFVPAELDRETAR